LFIVVEIAENKKMDSLLERIEGNKLDALYLFINETLRVRDEFDRFIASLTTVLPLNWSIQRVEVGHEFLSMVSQQEKLFDLLSGLEGLRTLIISDGYVPRKDRGRINTDVMLDKMSKARNLQILDLQRLQLQSQDQVELLTEFLELQECLEELRLTGLFICPNITLDPAIKACCEMPNLRSLCISAGRQEDSTSTPHRKSSLIQSSLHDLLTDEQCQTIAGALRSSSFLTSLDLRQNEKLTQAGYAAILQALEQNYDLWCSVLVVSFVKCVNVACSILLVPQLLTQCLRVQDNDTYQAKFNSLIELNQANRGDLLRSPTKEKLVVFLEKLRDDPTGE
jgi:hypothetical protein